MPIRLTMKTLFFVALVAMSSTLSAKSDLLHRWKLGYESNTNGGKIRGYQRWVYTDKSKYTIADMTVLEIPVKGKQETEMIPEVLKKSMELDGFSHQKIKDIERFEGFSKKLNRQVVIHLTTTPTKVLVTSAHYRPFYGRKIALEVELFSRLEHNVKTFNKTSYIPTILNLLISDAYAAGEDCTKCSGNPSCLLLCRSANAPAGTGTSAIPGMDLSGIQTELSSSNQQLSALNDSILAGANSIDATAASVNGVSAEWSRTNSQLERTSAQVDVNWNNSNQQAERLNDNLERLNTTVERESQSAQQTVNNATNTLQSESEQWRQLADERSERALQVAEKMSDPNHMFKLAASSAAGAVIGATVANLAISGIKAAVGFLVKWVSGDLRRMKDEELVKEFNQAMQVYDQSSKLGADLEKRIDNILASMELHNRFKLQNSEVLENIQRYVINTNFAVEDATACRDTDKLIDLNRQLTEYQSLAKILDVPNPLQKMCTDLKESFDKLAEIEGILQNARPNLLKAEAALTRRRSDNQNDAAKAFDRLRNGNMSEEVAAAHNKQRRRLYERNLKDARDLRKDVIDDCRDSFDQIENKPPKNAIRTYCEGLFTMDKSAPQFNLAASFPTISSFNRETIASRFATKYIQMGLDKHAAFERQREELFSDFDNETARHQEVTKNMTDRLNIDPEIALRELSSINRFIEKIMTEQAYLYTNGLKDKKRKIEEACAGIE